MARQEFEMSALQRAMIEKVGHDHGFEHVLMLATANSEAVTLASARHASRALIQLTAPGEFLVEIQASNPALLVEMRRTLPLDDSGASHHFTVKGESGLAALLRLASQLARALPSQAVQDFEAAAATALSELPAGLAGTEVERLVRQRVGQARFREAMLDYWGGACAVTGVAVPAVLRASHAKPWAECASDAERLDVFNGFLLSPNLDALFDQFLISFDETGQLLISRVLKIDALEQLAVHEGRRLRWIAAQHGPYLAFHRERFFRLANAD
jgi:putative restriction endonuclease